MSAACRALAAPLSGEEGSKWLAQALRQKTAYDDTHPSLQDRLRALRYPIARLADGGNTVTGFLPPAKPETSAEHFLGSGLPSLPAQLDHLWSKEVGPVWRDRHGRLREMRSELEALEQKAAAQPLSKEEAWSRASWTLELRGEEDALPRFREVLALNPHLASANFQLGAIMLSREDPQGVPYLGAAMARDHRSVIPGCIMLAAFFPGRGQAAEARRYKRPADRQERLFRMAQKERAGVRHRDQFDAPGLGEKEVADLREVLSSFARIERAYLVRKRVVYLSEIPFFVLAVVRWRRRWIEMNPARANEELLGALTLRVALPGDSIIAVFTGKDRLLEKFSKVPGAGIYSRAMRQRAHAPPLALDWPRKDSATSRWSRLDHA